MARQRLEQARQGVAFPGLTSVVVLVAACGEPAPRSPDAVPLDAIVTARKLTGAWDWIHYETEDGTFRRERERWTFAPTADRRRLVGRYTRDVQVRALDGTPFECNQKPRYHQRAEIYVQADVVATGVEITEQSYRTDPGPCDHGLRQLGTYLATIEGDELHLEWSGGEAVLVRALDEAPPDEPSLAEPPGGRWTWRVTSWTRAGMIRDEVEDWEIAAGDDGAIGATYVREVVERSPDGAPIPCAGAAAWGFVDRYLVRGRPMEDGNDGWRVEEIDVVPGSHPCIAATATRSLDTATVTTDGDHVVLQWRGKRRQVLARPGED